LVVTGYPVRPELREATQMQPEAARAKFDLSPERKTVLVFGGSRGAWAINQALMGILPDLLQEMQVIHISGTLTWPQVEENAAKLPAAYRQFYRPFPYLHEEMGAAFRAADLVVARAGASMLGECPAFGLPAILIPLAWAWRYQKVNADFMTEHGAAQQLTDEELPEKLLTTIRSLLQDSEKLARMRAAARQLAQEDGAVNLAQLITAVAARSAPC
jgi:UDP-N-acetylglucosamine--N-acetylmuramyl-(pentapeptide) pyrophosphoryl-undecaprenol N-acetylglucosamine transferase